MGFNPIHMRNVVPVGASFAGARGVDWGSHRMQLSFLLPVAANLWGVARMSVAPGFLGRLVMYVCLHRLMREARFNY